MHEQVAKQVAGDRGVELQRTTKDYVYGGQTIAKHSYVVEMDQFMRGFAYTALAAGQDISDRITLTVSAPADVLAAARTHEELLSRETLADAVTFAESVETAVRVARN